MRNNEVAMKPHQQAIEVHYLMGKGERALARFTDYQMKRTQSDAIQHGARVHAEALVATEKMELVDDLTRKAMMSHLLTSKLASVIAGNDLMLADELMKMVKSSTSAKMELLADIIEKK